MFALHWRDHGGRGQVIDLSILEPLFWVLGPQASLYQQNGKVPGRHGNRIEHTALRNAFRTKDDRWVVTSATTQNVAERLMGVIGRPELAEEEWFASHRGRLEHADELDQLLAEFIATRTLDEVREAFADGGAAVAPIFTIADIMADPHYAARETITEVDHPTLGPLAMQNMIAQLTTTPGRVRHPGPRLGEHNEEVYGELGVDAEVLSGLRERQVI
jgi:crotonobetainyl-CoA:carnitine CoA-transferase CaiB-like acyl-CoA transferase